MEAFDAEVAALTEGLQAALQHRFAQLANNLWACLENLEVVKAIYSCPCGSSQSALLNIDLLNS